MFARLTCILHSSKLALKPSYGNHVDCIVLPQKYINHGIQSISQRKKGKHHIHFKNDDLSCLELQCYEFLIEVVKP